MAKTALPDAPVVSADNGTLYDHPQRLRPRALTARAQAIFPLHGFTILAMRPAAVETPAKPAEAESTCAGAPRSAKLLSA